VLRVLRPLLAGAVCVGALVSCTATVDGRPSAAEAPATTEAAAPTTEMPPVADGAATSCASGSSCDEPIDVLPIGEVECSSRPTAAASFDERARTLVPDGDFSATSAHIAAGALTGLVAAVVDACGFQVMIDVTHQYPEPLTTFFTDAAISALHELAWLPAGLRCADLQSLGYGPGEAVDYWFFSRTPDLMDKDLDGIPCETVWRDVDRYMPYR